MRVEERMRDLIWLEVKPSFKGLTPSEREALKNCVEAAKCLDGILLKQVSPQNLNFLRRAKANKSLHRFFAINFGPWDRFRNNEPFMKDVGEKPKGAGFYPADLTVDEWENWLKNHPEERKVFESSTTLIKRENGRLVAIPYSLEFREELEEASRFLKTAASFLEPGPLKTFLESRADAFLTNEYRESELAWLDTDGFPFEVTIGPYEVYEDELLGLKAAFKAFIGIPDREATAKLKHFTEYVAEFDGLLAERFNYPAKGSLTPLVVAKDVMRAGDDANCARISLAFNLPNEKEICELKGSKTVFSNTLMEANFNKKGRLFAERVLNESDLDKYNFPARLLFILGHEIAHGLGPATVIRNGEKVGIEKLLKDVHSAFEEAKADTLGFSFLKYLVERKEVQEKEIFDALCSDIVSYFQCWQKGGFGSAHSSAALIEYNWLKADGALFYDTDTKKFAIIDPNKALQSLTQLSEELVELQMLGDYEKAKRFKENWSLVPSEITETLGRLDNLPLGIYPIFNLVNLES